MTVSKIANLKPMPSTNERINMIGVVHKMGNIRMIEKTNKSRLNIEIVDPCTLPYRSIILCIWEKEKENSQITQQQNIS